MEVDKKRKILSLKGARNRASRTRDGPRQAALNLSINILYGPNALARLARMQREMDDMHSLFQKRMLEGALRGIFK